MPMVMGGTRSRRLQQLKKEFTEKATDALQGGVIYVQGHDSKRSVAGKIVSGPQAGLRNWFNGRSLWRISTPARQSEIGGEIHSAASHTLPPEERAASMYATRDEIIDYMAGREALRAMEHEEDDFNTLEA